MDPHPSFTPELRQRAIADAVERLERPLLAYVERLLGDPERARDVVQDAFLRLCRHEDVLGNGHLRPWLFTVCRNRAMDEFRRRKSVAPESEALLNAQPSSEPAPEQGIETADAARAASLAMERLPETEREVIHLRYRGELSYREIAAVTGHSVGHVGVLLHTGLKRLRGLLGPALDLDGTDAPTARGAIR
jgi:RNA polymerase sigma-70 factor (ECF subfamily)